MTKGVRCVVRCRPTAERDNYVLDDKKSIMFPKRKDQSDGDRQCFVFDSIVRGSSQEEAYDECARGAVDSAFDGYNGTVMCYGQTGAGKTYTMIGELSVYAQRGIIPRAIEHIFNEVRIRSESDFTVKISFMEIYNENIVDLLSPESAEPLKIVEDARGSVVMGLRVAEVTSEEDALSLLFEGCTNRTIAAHKLNQTSNRSHCLFSIYLEQRSRVESSERVVRSKLHLVDLAGSERAQKTQNDDSDIAKESLFINKSLLFLEQVIIALGSRKREHVPYRQSKLTNVLRDSIGGNCRTVLVANVWMEQNHFEETNSTLKFASRMMQITNTAVVNVQYDPALLAKKYEKEIRDLKAELAMHDQIANRSLISYEPFTEEQSLHLRQKIHQYLRGETDELEIINLRQVREIFTQFKAIYKEAISNSQKNQTKAPKHEPQTQQNATKFLPAINVKTNEPQNENEEGVGDLEGGGFSVGRVFAESVRKLKAVPPTSFSPTVATRANENNPQTQSGKKKKEAKPEPVKEVKKTKGPTTSSVTEETTNTNTALPLTEPKKKTEPAFTQPEKETEFESTNDSKNRQTEQTPESNFPKERTVNERARAYEVYKQTQGMNLQRTINETKQNIRDKKKAIQTTADIVNQSKREIDALGNLLKEKRSLRNDSLQNVIDEDEYKAMQSLQEAKERYQTNRNLLEQFQTELKELQQALNKDREKILDEFETWFNSNGDQEILFEGNCDDVMDYQEKFELLQLNNAIQKERNPQSKAFYSALSNVKKKKGLPNTLLRKNIGK